MTPELTELVTFHLTGAGSGGDLADIAELRLRPALLAGYRDLTRLRYDYPLVLVNGEAGGDPVRSLSGLVDEALQEAAPRGAEGEALRRHVLRLEREMRALASRGAKASLSELWDLAEKNVLARTGNVSPEPPTDGLRRARGALAADGEVVDCDGETPVKLLTHAWAAVERERSRKFLETVDGLVLRLRNILRADFMKSAAARDADSLKGSVGAAHEAMFDFDAMSRILARASPGKALPESRSRRIRSALATLESQRFFALAAGRGNGAADDEPHRFVFDSCTRALEAFRERLPEMVGLIKAMSIAELEVDNRYDEARHDAFFSRFDETSPAPEDLELFPSYLVCLRGGRDDPAEKATLIELLSSGLPVKVLVQTDDVLEAPPLGELSLGVRSLQLAGMAVGLNSGYVLQSSSSNLYQVRDRIRDGLAYPGPALFSVFSGDCGGAADLPPYLLAASAMQSRAFPAFTYDPSAGPDWASRFRIGDNPQPDADWPVERFSYEDEDLQTVSQDVAFTFVDMAACDRRYARHFAGVPKGRWCDGMVPVADFLGSAPDGPPETVPYILMVDDDDVLHRVVVDDKLVHAARRCREMWHSLEELGGIHNSHARRLLDSEREIWEREKERELEALRGGARRDAEGGDGEEVPAAEAAGPDEAPAPPEIDETEEAAGDDPYIETARCTTCNECTELNNRMFAYNDNKQAYIADPDAGTYRDLVEAAEACQVSIIHPGKPRNPNEPNLEALIERADPFN